jgi:hypothetical protein
MLTLQIITRETTQSILTAIRTMAYQSNQNRESQSKNSLNHINKLMHCIIELDSNKFF